MDADPRSLRVLEVSLRKAGYNLTTCSDGPSALETTELSTPDLIITDTRLPGLDGFQLVERIKQNPDWASIPIMFLSSDTSVESKVRGLQLGVEDYLTKPIYIKEIVARIDLALQRSEREAVARPRSSLSRTRFTGSLGDMGLVDLLQTIDMSRKSGVLSLRQHHGAELRRGSITFRDGQLIDAEFGPLRGERAIYRLLLWSEGDFEIDFRPVQDEQRIDVPTQGILMEGMRRVDEWTRLCEQVPPLEQVFEVVPEELAARLAELPDEINALLRLFDGQCSLAEVIDRSDGDDLDTLSTISKLYFEGIIRPTQGGSQTGADEEVLASAMAGPAAGRDSDVASHAAEGDVPEVVPAPSTLPAPPADVPAAGALGLASGPVTQILGTMPTRTPAYGVDRAHPDAVLGGPSVGGNIGPQAPGPDLDADAPATRATFKGTLPAAGAWHPERATPPSTEPGGAGHPHPERAPEATELTAPSETEREDDAMAKKRKKDKSRSGSAGGERSGPKPPSSAAQHGAHGQGTAEKKAAAQLGQGGAVEVRHDVAKEAAKEAQSNVIQFPTAAKRTVATTQVAVNDETVAVAADAAVPLDAERRPADAANADEANADEAHAHEAKRPPDETQLRVKRDSDEAPRPGPGEVPRVVTEGSKTSEPAAPPAAVRRERREKKSATTTSGEIRAVVGGTGEHAAAADDFFRKTTADHPEPEDDFSDLRAGETMAPGARRAMYWTIGIVVGGLALIGGYQLWHETVIPEPVELGRAGPVQLPQLASRPTPSPGSGGPGGRAEPEAAAPSEPVAAPQVASSPSEGAPEEGAEPSSGAGEILAEEQPEPGRAAPPAEGAREVEAPPGAPAEDSVAEAAPAAATEGTSPAPASYEALLAQAARGRASQRIALYEQAIQMHPEGHEALSNLAFLLLNRGRGDDLSRARDYAERATRLDPSDALAWLALGAARDALRDRAGAREAYRNCVERGQGPHVRECRAMVR